MNLQAVHEAILTNEESASRRANYYLRTLLPYIRNPKSGNCEIDIQNCRSSIAQKIGQLALLEAYRDDPDFFSHDQESLAHRAYDKIRDPTLLTWARNYIVETLQIEECSNVIPSMEVIEFRSLQQCRVIAKKVLGITLPPDTTTEEAS